MIYVIATITAHPDKTDILINGAQLVIAQSRTEEGCIAYDLHRSVSVPETFVFIERWATRDHLNAHMQTQHFKVWREIADPCIAARTLEVLSSSVIEVL